MIKLRCLFRHATEVTASFETDQFIGYAARIDTLVCKRCGDTSYWLYLSSIKKPSYRTVTELSVKEFDHYSTA